MKYIRPILAAHDGLMADYARQVGENWRRAIGYGLIDGVRDAAALRDKLREMRDGRPEWMLVLFMSGHDREWATLDIAHEVGVVAPCGVIVTAKNQVLWTRLATYQRLSFVCNATREMSLHRWQTSFTGLHEALRVADVPLSEASAFVAQIAERDHRARVATPREIDVSRPYSSV